MPPTFTYPGVYIEELSSGVHTITGVATSIGAFVGWAPQGPVDEATLVESWSEFQTLFGGLDSRSYLGYSVNQFFANGGQQAYIVRIIWDGSLPPAPNTTPVPGATASAIGVGLATAVITAASTAGAVSGSSTLTVGAPVLQSISIAPASSPWLQVGQTQPFKAAAAYSDGTTQDITTTVSWDSSAPTVATVSNSGLATAIAPGTAILKATMGAVTASVTLTVSAATLTSITVTPAAPSIAAGQTLQFTATGSYSDGTSQNLSDTVNWTSGTPATATITGAGLATGVAAGASVITATLGAVSGNTNLTVGAAVMLSISVTPSNPPWIQPAATQQFKATALFSDGTSADVSATATWSPGNPLVASVSGTGLATGVAAGTSLITAASGAVSGSATLTVTTATLSSIAITPAAPSIAAGLTLQLAATGKYSDGTSQDLTGSAQWVSDTTANATVTATGGLVAGVKAGTAGITAAVGAVTSAKITVTVTAPVLSAIAVTPLNPAVASGQTQQFVATGTYSDGSTQNLTGSVKWSSSATAVATVTSGGLATAVAAGGTLTLFAANPGVWGNNLQVVVSVPSANPSRFGLQVLLGGKVVENFVNLSVTSTDPQYAVAVIDNDSQYITFINPSTGAPVVPVAAPAAASTPISFTGGADGSALVPASDGNFELAMTSNSAAGVYLLDRVDIFNLLCVPGETDAPTIQNLQTYCYQKRAFYIVDPPQTATTRNLTTTGPAGSTPGSLTGQYSINSAYYYPWVQAPDPLFGNRPALFPPCGFVAGIYAATDAGRGVWKAPAGIDASLSGVSGLQYVLTDLENGDLNIQAINCLRQFKVYGDVVWGARTLQGNDQAGSEWKYVPIRRLALYLESSLYNGTQWVVFEPNDDALWGQIRLNVGSFMQGLFLQGAFQGTTPQQAYFVKCDGENNPQASIDLGIVNILVGFAPLYPAEFVVIQIQQMAGQTQS